MDTNAVGCFIAELRKQKGYTQKELAEKLAVTDKAISRWETGKGLPDTSLLKPLSDVLGVSVGELLAGRRMDEPEIKDNADSIILETLQYAKRMSPSIGIVILFMVGIAFLLSPLFTAGIYPVWCVGIVLIAAAIVCIAIQKGAYTMNLTNKKFYLCAVVFQSIAFVLELLPNGIAMAFAAGPDERVINTFSYFSLTPWGYADFTPLLTGILTVVVLILGIVALIRFEKSAKYRHASFVCNAIALLTAIARLFILGAESMTAISYAVFAALLLSEVLQAAANRYEKVSHS